MIPGEITMFEEKTPDGQWVLKECPERVVWRQDLCQCDYPVGTILDGFCSSYRPNPSGNKADYQKFVNGEWKNETCSVFDLLWNQEECRCDWDKNAGKVQRRPKLKQVRIPSSKS